MHSYSFFLFSFSLNESDPTQSLLTRASFVVPWIPFLSVSKLFWFIDYPHFLDHPYLLISSFSSSFDHAQLFLMFLESNFPLSHLYFSLPTNSPNQWKHYWHSCLTSLFSTLPPRSTIIWFWDHWTTKTALPVIKLSMLNPINTSQSFPYLLAWQHVILLTISSALKNFLLT